ncbi:hypothetical protein NFI96_031923, partial [Prochilodus magdalenae]
HCCGAGITAADRRKLDKLIRKASSVLCSVEVVGRDGCWPSWQPPHITNV